MNKIAKLTKQYYFAVFPLEAISKIMRMISTLIKYRLLENASKFANINGSLISNIKHQH